MNRWLLNLIGAMSLLVCVAVLVMWLRSRNVVDQYVVSRGNGMAWCFTSLRGQIALRKNWYSASSSASAIAGLRSDTSINRYPVTWGNLGFSWADVRWRTGFGNDLARSLTITIPYWALTLAASLSPGVAIYRLSRKRRPAPGMCRKCGYDLRATPDRCPECGTVTSNPTRANEGL
jgi:hypothetical protein